MVGHLGAGARYLVQLDLLDGGNVTHALASSEQWEMTRGDTTLRITWSTEWVDLDAGLQRQRSRIEILSRLVGGGHRCFRVRADGDLRWGCR
jgi:hypothetical protein